MQCCRAGVIKCSLAKQWGLNRHVGTLSLVGASRWLRSRFFSASFVPSMLLTSPVCPTPPHLTVPYSTTLKPAPPRPAAPHPTLPHSLTSLPGFMIAQVSCCDITLRDKCCISKWHCMHESTTCSVSSSRHEFWRHTSAHRLCWKQPPLPVHDRCRA